MLTRLPSLSFSVADQAAEDEGSTLTLDLDAPITALSSTLTHDSLTPPAANAVASPLPAIAPLSIPRPERDYFIPSSLIHAVFRHARTHYDTTTSDYIRSRTLLILRLMEKQMFRIEAVRERLMPAEEVTPQEHDSSRVTTTATGSISALPSSSSSPASAHSATSETSIGALDALSQEIAHLAFHRLQLRLLLPFIKSTATVIDAYTHLHRLLSELRMTEKKLGLGNTFGDARFSSSPSRFVQDSLASSSPAVPSSPPSLASSLISTKKAAAAGGGGAPGSKAKLSNTLLLRRKASKILTAQRSVLRARMRGLAVKGAINGSGGNGSDGGGKEGGKWQWEECKRKLAVIEREEVRLRGIFSGAAAAKGKVNGGEVTMEVEGEMMSSTL